MIIFFGPAGSGKSLQGQLVARKFGWKWLSVGQVLRDAGEFGDILKSGDLVENEKVVQLMEAAIEKVEAEGMNAILDGYPRDITQAEWIMSNSISRINGAIVLDVPREELLHRIAVRSRADDTPEAIEKRLSIYEQNICSILPLFEKANVKVTTINGLGSVDEVTSRIVDELKSWAPNLVETNKVASKGREASYGE
jgi:adenylate kinase